MCSPGAQFCHGGWPLRAVRDGSPYRDASPRAMAPFLRTPAGMASDDRVSLGKAGEDAACRELCRRGYAIVARRFRTREGEIDIIARDGETLVFVEVKARRSERRGTASEAVGRHKQMRLARIALCYLHVTAAVGQRCRFDVVSVHYAPGAEAPVVQVIQGAFEAESAT